MTTAIDQSGLLLTDLPTLASAVFEDTPEWLGAIRRSALDRYLELGLPTSRDEEWRSTSLKSVAATRFGSTAGGGPALSPAEVEAFDFPGLRCPRVVFVNGRYAPERSEIGGLPEGVEVLTITEALQSRATLLREHLTRYADFEQDAMTALNTAFIEDGTVIHVARGVVVESPIHILNITTTAGEATITHPRNLVIAEDSAELTVIEDYASPGDDVYLTNAVTEILVGANANVRHYLIERESERAFNISTLKAHQGRDSRFASHSVLVGGALVRNNVHPVLAGENCHSLLNGLYLGRDRQHMDNHMRVEHAAPHCDSRQYYRGIMTDEARGIFSGRIVVARDAQKTDAVQSNQNLLLSPGAHANTKPQLEIYADDVKCTHGATIGQLDEEAVFYLRSRGMSEQAAQGMLVYSFARESLERMDLKPVRDEMTRILLQRLPHTKALEAYIGTAGDD